MTDVMKKLDELVIPEPGTQEWESMIDSMRIMDKYAGVINIARESIQARGLNFEEEFEKWKVARK